MPNKKPGVYKNRYRIKSLIHKSGLDRRDIARSLEIPPSSFSNKLNGYAPMSDREAAAVRKMCLAYKP